MRITHNFNQNTNPWTPAHIMYNMELKACILINKQQNDHQYIWTWMSE